MAKRKEGGDLTVAATPDGGGKARRVPPRGWTKAKRTLFLDTLAATAHVTMSAEAAGMGVNCCYGLRRRDAAFAALWEIALELGYGRIESELLAKAMGGALQEPGATTAETIGGDINAIAPDAARSPVAPIDPELALRLLTLRRVGPKGRRPQSQHYKIVPIEEVEAALMTQLAVVEKRLRRVAAQGGLA